MMYEIWQRFSENLTVERKRKQWSAKGDGMSGLGQAGFFYLLFYFSLSCLFYFFGFLI